MLTWLPLSLEVSKKTTRPPPLADEIWTESNIFNVRSPRPVVVKDVCIFTYIPILLRLLTQLSSSSSHLFLAERCICVALFMCTISYYTTTLLTWSTKRSKSTYVSYIYIQAMRIFVSLYMTITHYIFYDFLYIYQISFSSVQKTQ